MRILLANSTLAHRAGSEMWTKTMCNELRRFNEVDVYVSTIGENKLINAGCDKAKRYDLGIINHNICLQELQSWNIDRRILTCHGIWPELEQPVPGADVYVSVSEEVQAHLWRQGYNSRIIRNPIDVDHFYPVWGSRELKRIVWMNNRNVMPEMVKVASNGYESRVVSGWQDGVRDALQWADLVVSSGRGIYEALSCGKNACVVNWCGCDGMVTPENIYVLRKNNCSGRYHREFWPPEQLHEEFRKYDPALDLRPYVLEHHDVRKIAREYVTL